MYIKDTVYAVYGWPTVYGEIGQPIKNSYKFSFGIGNLFYLWGNSTDNRPQMSTVSKGVHMNPAVHPK